MLFATEHRVDGGDCIAMSEIDIIVEGRESYIKRH